MARTLANFLDCDNAAANDDEPDMLICHCPRAVSVMPWDAIAAQQLEWFRLAGWVIRREGDAVHAITPLHPAMVM